MLTSMFYHMFVDLRYDKLYYYHWGRGHSDAYETREGFREVTVWTFCPSHQCFQQIGPLGQFGLVVAMSVCLFAPFPG